MTRPKGSILLIEDDRILGSAIKSYLAYSGYEVVLEDNGDEGLKQYGRLEFDLVLLDIMLPTLNGYEVASMIRKQDCELPIIFITGRDLGEDRIKGFRIGADDYLIKPFSLEELRMRIRAVIRRSRNNHAQNPGVFHFGRYTFDYTNHLLISRSEERRLTRKESDLLHLLVNHKNQVLRRDIALKTIWGRNDYFMGRSMDVYISKLRKMLLEDPGVSIVNIHNTGFMLSVRT